MKIFFKGMTLANNAWVIDKRDTNITVKFQANRYLTDRPLPCSWRKVAMLSVLIIMNALWLLQTNRQTNLNFNEVFPFQLIQKLDELITNAMQSKDKRD